MSANDMIKRDQLEQFGVALAAVVLPALLTAILLRTGPASREYVFLYMAVVAVIAVLRGLLPALLAAAVSFLLVDYFLVPPVHTLTIADEQDLVNLAIFFGTAGLIGYVVGRRRQAQLNAQRLAEELRQSNVELIRLNREQAQAAQAAVRLARTEQQVQLLQQAEQDLRNLLATISHELRTPIGTILTDSTNMLRTQEMNASVRYRIEGIATEARRLNRLLADMLDMARIESGALHLTLEPVQVNDAVAAAAERLKRIAPDRRVEWDSTAAAVSVLADWDSLGQIFDNLLDNANRYAPAGTPITVAVSQEEPGRITIRVIDRGPGVPDGMRDRLFSRFVRGASDAGDGSGLGLAITRGLVEAHAGTIELEDGHAGETTFRFTIPKAEPQPSAV
jgi:K+-sensing histidine kinase KdpD